MNVYGAALTGFNSRGDLAAVTPFSKTSKGKHKALQCSRGALVAVTLRLRGVSADNIQFQRSRGDLVAVTVWTSL